MVRGLEPVHSMLKSVPSMRQTVGVDGRDRYRFVDREDGGEYGFLWPTSAFAGEGSGKIPESMVTWRAIYPGVNLGTIPEATATFANFQMYAQFHDCLSQKVCKPAKRARFRTVRRAVGKHGRRAGF